MYIKTKMVEECVKSGIRDFSLKDPEDEIYINKMLNKCVKKG